jgi:hypothetical protein
MIFFSLNRPRPRPHPSKRKKKDIINMSLPVWSELQHEMAYVGWESTVESDLLFSEGNLNALSAQISDCLQGVDPQGRTIRVALDKIAGVLSNVYKNQTRPRVGDIFSRYIIPQNQDRCDLREINNQAVNIIVRSIKDEIEMAENNKKLTVWTTVLGDFNKEGLRAHPPLKIRRRHPQHMAFNMNY